MYLKRLDFCFLKERLSPAVLWLFLARGCGLGLLPLMPGTWGSLGGLVLFGFFHYLFSGNQLLLGAAVLILVFISFPLSAAGIKHYSTPDPSPVVIDEFAGQFLALFPLWWSIFWPALWPGYLLGFVLFRFFDALKIFPVKVAEKLPGAAGVVADDLVAGVMANIILTAAGYLVFGFSLLG